MSINEMFRRSLAKQFSDVQHIGHAYGLEEAAQVCELCAADLRASGKEDQARGLDGLEVILRMRSAERLALAEKCPVCSGVVNSHAHMCHCNDGPQRACTVERCEFMGGAR